MKLSKTVSFLAFVCTFISMTFVTAPISHAGELNMTNEQNAKVGRFKARARVVNNRKQNNYYPETEADELASPSGFEDDKCGVVDIGNIKEEATFGIPKDIDVIITGDVINTGNKCN